MKEISKSSIDKVVHGPQRHNGNFIHQTTFPDGSSQIDNYSWASGMGSLMRRSEYRRVLGKSPPEWIDDLHPNHIIQLCDIAISTSSILPDSWSDGCVRRTLRGITKEDECDRSK